MAKAGVRATVEAIDGVTRTWFEWHLETSGNEKVLVVEVDFATDPNETGHRPHQLETILETVREFLTEKTTMIVHRLKVVPEL